MTRTTAVVILISLSMCSVNFVDTLIQESLGKFLGSFTAVKRVRIPELLNQLCNESQGSNALRRDACYGCFYRASVLPQGYSMLVVMSTCANDYLNNTRYGHCQTYLRNATRMPNSRVSPTVIYCTFLECIRQVNKDSLDIDIRRAPLQGITLGVGQRKPFIFLRVPAQKNVCIVKERNLTAITLRECVREAARMFPNFNNTDVQLAQLFVNTTACVLAKTRCAYTNPVTGEIQDDDIANKLHLSSINAILVNTDYDFNIVQLPFRYGSVDVCTKYRNVQQATWPSVAC